MLGAPPPLNRPVGREQSSRTGRPRILCVDDDRWVLEGLSDVLGRTFAVSTAASPIEGIEILKREPDEFAVVLSDMRMPGMPGSEFLRMARLTAPDAVRLLLTGDADMAAAVRAVNDGQLFRFLIKPCESRELMRACVAALGQHRLQTSERVLLQETLRGCVDALAEVLSLTNPATFGHAGRAKTLGGKLARAARLRDWWEVEVAALLENLGAVTLPPTTTDKLHARAGLTEAEAAMVRRVPHVTRQLLSKIPRLDGVLEILATHRPALADPEATPATASIPPGARVLRIALDYTELEAEAAPPSVALSAMRSREIYDEDLLDLFAAVVGVDAAPPVREIPVSELRVGMTLAADARSTRDSLLLARGQCVTERLIERLTNLGNRVVREPLRVFDTPADQLHQ
ncbi:MAG TPA: HD domain-containing phosphohydrolase [Solirubrobacteraceae bacterium]|nr:HD domain-containing phosphohydrolase [Solirubrobacteraceae bacterium]